MIDDEVIDINNIERDKHAHVNGIENQDEVPLLPMVTDNSLEENKEEMDFEFEEDANLVHADENIVDGVIIRNNSVDQLDNDEKVTVYDVYSDEKQSVSEGTIAREASDTLRSDNKEINESEHIISRLIPRPLTVDNLNKYER